ncbi:hypothetical protein BD31_I0913 [Candidatus Nitrosopumilus salaria BD31]|uniref:Uncharacterized protein n=1 Tax=Candidatus Nitrosopumilus salarius BD31 TaxID=859350 RepID=I3CZQ8_9ARCH|nr:hypothetical protein [Candidatus Nitrosopumilus salaria]EIJ64951.1 hypothetical protein BD31_I0913 [Candidatus Nitrosopumilus salaria BD31]
MTESFDCKYCFEPIYEKDLNGKREFFDNPECTKKHKHSNRAYQFHSDLKQLKQIQNSNLTRFHEHDNAILQIHYEIEQLQRKLKKYDQKFGL